MRQFLFGVVVMVVLWWAYSAFAAPSADAAKRSGGQDLGDRLGVSPTAAQEPQTAGGSASAMPHDALPPPAPLDAKVRAEDAGPADESLRAAVAAGDPLAIDQAWRRLAAGTGAGLRQALTQATAGVEDPAALISGLGTSNAFLHSADGRALAKQIQAALVPLADEAALPLSTRLIEACMRGPIEKADTDAKATVDSIYAAHRVRVDRYLCDPANVARARTHVVVRGDTLGRIAGRFRREKILVDDGSLAILNRIHNPNALQVGQKVKVPVDPIRAVVEKRSFLLAVYVGEQILRLYWVGHGAESKTPIAEFTVAEKLEHPEWFAPGGGRVPYGHPDNILGDYFIKFANASYTGFGAHGTPMPETIGTMSSMGCIRMYAQDIAELFRLLPRGATVEVRDSH